MLRLAPVPSHSCKQRSSLKPSLPVSQQWDSFRTCAYPNEPDKMHVHARDRLTVLSHCISAKQPATSMAQLCFIKLSPYSVCQEKRYRTILVSLVHPKGCFCCFISACLNRKGLYYEHLGREVLQVLVNSQVNVEALFGLSFPTE